MKRTFFRAAAIAGATLLSASLFAEPVVFHPNSEKYRDSSIPNAKGRSGAASIEARALLNRDHTTDLEVTTGDFDDTAGAPGTIAKVQVDYPAGGTDNFNGLDAGGNFSTTLTGLPAHSTVGVQASVRGIDAARTDVVTVSETVKHRPDLTVASISAPENAYRGLLTDVRANIRELNGDTGARANCVLLANGSEIDRAEGIWVDANGTVDCTFAYTFTANGSVHLDVVVNGVNPGDWDDANNTASVDIQVVNPPERFYSWDTNMSEEKFDRTSTERYSWGEYNRDEHGYAQNMDWRGVIRKPVTLTGLSFSIDVTSDGNPVYSAQSSDFVGPFRRGPFMRCSMNASFQPEVNVCFDADRGYTTVAVSFGAGDATYRSWGWATRNNPFGPEVPRYEWNTTTVDHAALNRFGSGVTIDVNFQSGETTWVSTGTTPIGAPEHWEWIQPMRCAFDDFYRQTICQEVNWTRDTRRGRANGF
jgi:hypothetical protein